MTELFKVVLEMSVTGAIIIAAVMLVGCQDGMRISFG